LNNPFGTRYFVRPETPAGDLHPLLDVKQAIELCNAHRKLLRGQYTALRTLINGSSADSKHAIKSEAVTLQQLYRKSLITSITISERMALEAELLVQDPGKLAQLMNAHFRLQATHQDVAKLLKDVAEGDRPKI
jgi:hypothetical protein